MLVLQLSCTVCRCLREASPSWKSRRKEIHRVLGETCRCRVASGGSKGSARKRWAHWRMSTPVTPSPPFIEGVQVALDLAVHYSAAAVAADCHFLVGIEV